MFVFFANLKKKGEHLMRKWQNVAKGCEVLKARRWRKCRIITFSMPVMLQKICVTYYYLLHYTYLYSITWPGIHYHITSS